MIEKPDRSVVLRLALCSLAAIAFCLIVDKYILRAWFQEDDFAWLGLGLLVHRPQDLLHALFAPMAQGTIRPLSERAFYLVFYSLFHLNALPYRMLVLATQIVNLALLSTLAYALVRSFTAALIAPILWTANVALAWPLTWTPTYNEILCSCIFLASFLSLVLFAQTANRRYEILQWLTFLIGFGVLEINVVYPAVALLYVSLFARPLIRRTLPLWVPSIVFAIVHNSVRDGSKGIYALHFDESMLTTLLHYWAQALSLGRSPVLAWTLSVLLLSFALFRTSRGDRLPLLFLGWFLIVLAPFLPVRDHFSDYYLTVPLIGLALLGSYAVAVSFRSQVLYRPLALAALGAYLFFAIPASRAATRTIWAQSVPVKKLVLGIEAAHAVHPDKTILLEGVDDSLFWNGVYDHPFRLFGLTAVYLTPATAARITPVPALANVANYTIPELEMRDGLARGSILVYGVETGSPREITTLFTTSAPTLLDVGHPPMESLLGPGWYPSEGDYRWMSGTARVHLGVPAAGGSLVKILAICPTAQLEHGPLAIWIDAANANSPRTTVRTCRDTIGLTFPITLPTGAKDLDLGLHVDRILHYGQDPRDLGLAVQKIEVVSAG